MITVVFQTMLLLLFQNITEKFPFGEISKKMWKFRFSKFVLLICVCLLMAFSVFSQENSLKDVKSQEVSEEDGIPVLAKHLPD